MAIMALDQRFFCDNAAAKESERLEAVAALLQVFVDDSTAQSSEKGDEDEDDIPASMRRALPRSAAQ